MPCRASGAGGQSAFQPPLRATPHRPVYGPARARGSAPACGPRRPGPAPSKEMPRGSPLHALARLENIAPDRALKPTPTAAPTPHPKQTRPPRTPTRRGTRTTAAGTGRRAHRPRGGPPRRAGRREGGEVGGGAVGSETLRSADLWGPSESKKGGRVPASHGEGHSPLHWYKCNGPLSCSRPTDHQTSNSLHRPHDGVPPRAVSGPCEVGRR